MALVLLFGVFICLFLLFLLIGKKTKRKSDLFLGLLFALFGLTIAGAYFEVYNFNNNFPFPNLLNISWIFLFLHGPALWFYILSLTKKDFKLKTIHLLHLIPFVTFLILQYIHFFSLNNNEKIHIVQNEHFINTVFYKISVIAIGISTLSYNICSLKLINKNNKRILQEFSKIENKDLKWLKTLIVASIVLYSINVALFNLNTVYQFSSYHKLTLITYTFASIFVLFLGYYGLQQPEVFTNLKLPKQEKNDIKIDKNIPNERKEEIDKIIFLMEHQKVFLNPEITLAKMSELLHLKPLVLSELLNKSFNQNFFDFINKHRIEEFKIQALKKENQHLSILGIAYECGFNSKAAFYRAFKKFEKTSPTNFINKSL